MPNLPWQKNTIWQLTLIGTTFGQQVVNVHHFEATEALEATLTTDEIAVQEGQDLATDWITNCKTAWLLTHTPEYTLTTVNAQTLERPSNFRHKLTTSENAQTTANVGTASGSAEDPQQAACLRWRSTIAGKQHRGRTYIGPLNQNWVSDGKILSTGQTPINAYGSLMTTRYKIGGTMGNSYLMTVYSKPYNSGEYQYASRKTGSLQVVTPPDYGGNSTNITAHQLDTTVRVQRRRQIGVGS